MPNKKTTLSYRSEIPSGISLIEEYSGSSTKILHRCDKCSHKWKVTPSHILRGSNCPDCNKRRIGSEKRMPLGDYKKIIGVVDIILLGEYHNDKTKTRHKCLICSHEWIGAPNTIKKHGRCPNCISGAGYSKAGIKWLNTFDNSRIQHAANGGEYRIPSTRFHVDGYDSETNTVYEFLGDKWHGNPNLYEDDEKCHPFNNKTAKELQNETEERFKIIKNLGYDIVYIWETDFGKCL